MKVKAWRVIIAGILFALIGQVIHTLGVFLGMSYYMDPKYSSLWSKLMMPTAGPPPPSFMAYSLGFGIIIGILFSLVYAWIRGGLKGKSNVAKGLFYGFILFLVSCIPGFLSLYLLINIPLILNILWLVEGLIIDLIGGIVIALLVK